MAWGWVVCIVGSWWVGDDVIHALFGTEAKLFLATLDRFVILRIQDKTPGPPIGDGIAEMSRWGSRGRGKFAGSPTRVLAAVSPFMGEIGQAGMPDTDLQICITVCSRRCRQGGCADLRILGSIVLRAHPPIGGIVVSTQKKPGDLRKMQTCAITRLGTLALACVHRWWGRGVFAFGAPYGTCRTGQIGSFFG